MPAEPSTETALTLCAESGDATPALSSLSVWSYSVVVALLAIVPVVLILRNLGLSRRARSSGREDLVLRPGPAVLEGRIDHPYEPPLRVEITQTGTRVLEGREGWYQWTETSRRTVAGPFKMVLPSRQSVEVRANDRVRLLLDVERTEKESETVRRRIAEVRDGDTIFVSGRLEAHEELDAAAGGYRGGVTKKQFSLVPGAGGMLISKNPLDEVFLGPIRHYLGALALLAGVLAIIHVLFAGFHTRTGSGELIAGKVTAKRVVRRDDRDNYKLDIRLGDGTTLEADPTNACYERVRQGDRVPVLRSPRMPDLWQIGTAPSVNLVSVFGGFLVLVAGIVAYIQLLRSSRRWYGGRLLDEEDHPSG